ncbi:29790_t:CDS:2, partial [Gigaspora margarita]
MNSKHFLENTDLDNNNKTSSDIDISDDENSLNVLNDNYELPNDNITSQGQITRFATRLRHTEKNMNIIIRADIVCCRAGAAIVVRWMKKNKYSVRSVNLEHNHLLDSAAIKFDPGHHRLSHNENAHIQMLHDSGVP